MSKRSRPYMPGYGLKDEGEGAGLLTWAFVEERMRAARNYWLANSRPDGRPHVTPIWGLWHTDHFYFGTDTNAQKAQNLDQNASVVVHLESGDEAVILEGQALHVGDAKLVEELDDQFRAKYDVPLVGEAAIFGVQIERAFAWLEADFPGTATRWIFGRD